MREQLAILWGDTMRYRPANLVVLLLACACATTGTDGAKDGVTGLGPGDVTGGMVQHATGVDTPILRAAAFGPGSVAVTAGAAHSARLDRTPTGTWRGGASLVSGYRFPERLDVELSYVDGRLTGPSVDVRYAPVPGGFRLDGLWMGENVSLEVTSRGAQVRADRWTCDVVGRYVSPDLSTVELLGEAARLDAPVLPQMALMLLLFGWGVR